MKGKATAIGLLIAFLVTTAQPQKPRDMERLSRGVVAVRQADGKVFIGWRMFATDDERIAFNVFRSVNRAMPEKVNEAPINKVTFFIDGGSDATKGNAYSVREVINGKEGKPSESFTIAANAPPRQYISLPLQTPQGYTPNDASVGDLDGDGEYEIVLHQTGRGRDNSQAGMTDPPILQAYKLDGRLMWTINLGRNIREGAHYTQFMVYDLDGDGRAEIACKTADGTKDGVGTVIGDANADWRNPEGSTASGINSRGESGTRNTSGFILKGPEYLSVFDGRTGAALATTKYLP